MKFQTYLLIVITLALLGVVGYGANYLINQNRQLTQTQTFAEDPALIEEQEKATELAMDLAEKTEAVIVFEAEGSFSQLEKDVLKQKIVEPYVAYYQDLYALEDGVYDNKLISFAISKNEVVESSEEYPYVAQAIYETGANQAFVVMLEGDPIDQGGTVQWWYPECMIECYFSDQFQADYPEIVELAN